MEPFGHYSFPETFVSDALPTPNSGTKLLRNHTLKYYGNFKYSLITEFNFLLQMWLFSVNMAAYLFLWTAMSFCWLWDKSYTAVFEWFPCVGIVAVSWSVIRILATLISVCLSFSKYQCLVSWYFVKVLVLFL